MKVLQINATYASGSTGTIVQDLQQCCHNSGIDCYVAYAQSHLPPSQIQNGYKIGNIFSNKLHALLARVNGQQAYFSYFPTIALLRYIRQLKPDVIHLHNLHSNYINLNMLLRFLAHHNIATVVTLHDCWFYTGGCFHYTNAHCNKWQSKCGNCPKKHQDTPAYLFDLSSKILKDRYKYFSAIQNPTIVGVSEWITKECQKSVFKGKHCITIYNGIDTDVFKPTPSNLREEYGLKDKYIILGPASKWLDPVNKEVFQTVTKSLDNDTVLFLFGCNQHIPVLPTNVKTIGFTRNKKELAMIYSMADVFVNCTREDTLPTINLEAQACGTPIITFANTGATETVDIKYGIGIETGDEKTLVAAIKMLKKYSKASEETLQKWISENFERNKNYEKYIHLYNEIFYRKNG